MGLLMYGKWPSASEIPARLAANMIAEFDSLDSAIFLPQVSNTPSSSKRC